MREKKEYHRNNLPHYQQPGQAYFLTWSLKDAIPAKAFQDYTFQMEVLQNQLKGCRENKSMENRIIILQQEYDHLRRKYIKAYNDMLDAECNPSVNLLKPENTEIISNTFRYWEGKKLHNYAFTIMSNHIHWVFQLLEKDDNGHLIYLEDILQSVKRYSANRINKVENRLGSLWQKESFDTTIRNHEHLAKAINYTLNNPVNAGLIDNWQQWPGSYCSEDCL